MKVRANELYEKMKVKDKELGRIPKAGEEWEVTEERYKTLTSTNEYGVTFVEKIKEKRNQFKKIDDVQR